MWISGPAFLYTFLTSYSVELFIVVLIGASSFLFAYVSREFAPVNSIEDQLGYLVWFLCALRALLLASWGPLNWIM